MRHDGPGDKSPDLRMFYKNIFLYEEKFKVTPEELSNLFPNKKIYICDFYLEGAEKGKRIQGGFEYQGIVCIDHHFPIPEMEKYISSTNLAAEYVDKFGIVPKNSVVIIHHTDTDSILSSAILTGILRPEQKFVDAAIAADHTGEPNEIADLLQYLQRKKDIKLSFKNLLAFLEDAELDDEAKILLQERLGDRALAKKLVKEGKVKTIGHTALLIMNKKFDSALMPALLPNAKVILVARPHDTDKNRWIIKVRLGLKVPKGMTLKNIMKGLDPNYGGRWNAGNNQREGHGTNLNPEQYAKMINRSIDKLINL